MSETEGVSLVSRLPAVRSISLQCLYPPSPNSNPALSAAMQFYVGGMDKHITSVLSHHLLVLGIYLTSRSRYHEAYLKRHRVLVECTISITDDCSDIVQISDLPPFGHKVTT